MKSPKPSGRPRMFTKRNMRYLERLFSKDRRRPLTEITNELARVAEVITRTVRKALHTIVIEVVLLMEDGALVHCSNLPNKWREKMGIKRLKWPANSPDLNPILDFEYYIEESKFCVDFDFFSM